MDRVKKVTHQQLVDFVNQQKPDRKIDSLCCDGKGIGCLLTQYCRKTFKNKITNVGYFSCLLHKEDATYKIICDEKCSTLLKQMLDKKVQNYEQVQKFVKEFYTGKKYYKLLTQDLKSHNNTQWELNKTITVSVPGNKMCTNQVLHCYNHPLLAVILNPIHANISNPKLFEISVDEIVAGDGLKFASKSQTLIKELELPEISLEQKIEFSIRVAKLVCKDEKWNLWADSWLNGSDKSKKSASAAASAARAYAAANVYDANAAAYAAAAYAADAAYWAAYARAAYAWAVSTASASAAWAVSTASAASAAKDEFNQKIIDIIEEIVNITQ